MESVPGTEELASWVKVATVVLVAIAVLLFAGGAVFRKKLAGWPAVAYSVVLFCALLTSPVAAVYWARGPELASEGVHSRGLKRALDDMDEFLDSEVHIEARDSHYVVFLLGDSTHYYALSPRQRMLPQLRSRLPNVLASEIEIYTVARRGFDAFDYYFLTNRLMEEGLDLIILPVNLRTFGLAWSAGQLNVFPELQGYVRLEEFFTAAALDTALHPSRWEHLLLRKLDVTLFDGGAESFIRGVRQRYRSTQDALTLQLESIVSRYADPISSERIQPKLTPEFIRAYQAAHGYLKDVGSDHEMLNAFRALNDLAARHGTDILYYTVQPEVLDTDRLENFAVIRNSLLESPNVYFATLPFTLEEVHFARWEHVTPTGMQITAGHLADALAEILPPLIEEKLGNDTQE